MQQIRSRTLPVAVLMLLVTLLFIKFAEASPTPDFQISGFLRATRNVCLSPNVGDSLDAFGTVNASNSPALAELVARYPGAEFTFTATAMTVSEKSHVEWYPAHGIYRVRYSPGILTVLMDTSPDASSYDPFTFQDGEVILRGAFLNLWFSAPYANSFYGLSTGAQLNVTSGALQEQFRNATGESFTVNASGTWSFTYGHASTYPYSGAIQISLSHESGTPVERTTWGSLKTLLN